ncbi:MAG: hypothetical protein H6623_05840 [Bdellovibrionaceae bacterium]|nr:hypothetical protein [Pseudobdellovibrionaceae bacterium]
MLIAIFLGLFGIWGAILTAIRISLEGGWKRERGGEVPAVQASPIKERAGLKLHSASNPSVRQAFSDLWKEILKGA